VRFNQYLNNIFGVTSKRISKNTALMLVFAVGLGACQHQQKAPVVQKEQKSPFETGSAMLAEPTYGIGPLPTTGMIDVSRIASTEDIQVFPLEGAVADPFAGSKRHRSILENTTTGGYTVLTPGVQVFPLDGKEQSFIPVEPALYTSQNNVPVITQNNNIAQTTMIGEDSANIGQTQGMTMFGAASSDLPPIIAAPQLTMPAPSAMKPSLKSPFAGGMQSLTGYPEGDAAPITLSQKQERAETVQRYQSLAERSGSSVTNMPISQQEPLALHQRWSTNTTSDQNNFVSTSNDLPPEQPRRLSPSATSSRPDGGFLTGY
jgi:hypothetical protein